MVSGAVGAPPNDTLRRLLRSYLLTLGECTIRCSMVGTAPHTVIFSRSISSITRSGSNLPALNTSFDPAVSAVHTTEWMPATWNSGEVSRLIGGPPLEDKGDPPPVMAP